jgi:hypothetical protein
MQVDLSGFNIVRPIRCIRYDLEFATALFVPRGQAFSLSARCHFRVSIVGEPVTDNSLSSRHAPRVHKVTTVDPTVTKGRHNDPLHKAESPAQCQSDTIRAPSPTMIVKSLSWPSR